jgi:hypothetical protein
MPILKDSDTPITESGVPVNTPNVNGEKPFLTNEDLKTSTIFNKERNLDSIVQYVKGMKWTVNYFLQIKNINDPVRPPDISLPVTVQKYHRIDKLVLVLQDAVNQEDFNNVTGSATINCGFLPYIGDAFIATLVGGREAIFVLTNVEIKTYNLHPVYNVEFKLLFLLDNGNAEIYNDLVMKTIQTYVYDKEHLLDYSAPIILAADYTRKINLKNIIPEIADYYLRTFTTNEKNVLALPTPSSIYIDTMLADFVYKIISPSDSNLMTRVTRIDVDLKEDIRYTVWDAIVNRNKSLLKLCTKNIDFKYTPYTQSNVLLRNVSYLGISFMANVINEGDTPVVPVAIDISIPTVSYTNPLSNGVKEYVLTDKFYTLDTANCGLLEQMLIAYLNSENLNTDSLYVLIDEYPHWSTREQFYLIPILIALIRDSISRTYSSL